MRQAIEIVEVSARDGLQNESVMLTTGQKIELVCRAVDAGVRRIEVASFVNPKRVPQMADAEAVCSGLPALDGVTTIGLVLNRRGAERALLTRVDELGVVVSASDGFGIANQGRSAAETVNDAVEIIALARAAGRRAQVTISVAFGCPFDGEVSPFRVAAMAQKLAEAGPVEIALGDTIGVATPVDVMRVFNAVREAVPDMPIRCHFHDTRNTGVANAWTAMQLGAATLDASIGGIGGCPFAPGASGNVATEDLLYPLARAGISTGLSLEAIIETAQWLGSVMGQSLPGRVSRAPRFPSVAQP
ncbi:hydroxymethylglutaryl-CoA lyase [Novosphingobium sp. 17-62-19]|uniref:hydroxymethylglutaryl-CoA lyase n=1 Tax=Novosphingobium sp. 17-62-19 TaxID=1970406 RepID=UPI00260129FC|nr:hydroxymethylglutaryl-CoA lyase [Novosphingobium sp. 17-62-19]HQS95518.1 hydroxymethylglutaryl-CoA lyase [Novosphingobium sp.]